MLVASLAAVAILGLTVSATAQNPSKGPARTAGPKQRTAPQVEMVPNGLTFGPTEIGQVSAPQDSVITNISQETVTITAVTVSGSVPAEFTASIVPALPLVLTAGQTEPVTVDFQPLSKGLRSALLRVSYTAGTDSRVAVANLKGVALGLPGDETNVNAGGNTYVDTLGVEWSPDYGFSGGSFLFVPGAVSGTLDGQLYKRQRVGSSFSYSLPLPAGGYEVVLHFLEPTASVPGLRVFDVTSEGQLVVDDLDLAAGAGLKTAHTETHYVVVNDGALDLDFTASVASATVAAIEVSSSGVLTSDVASFIFGAVPSLTSLDLPFTLTNDGSTDVNLSQLAIMLGASGTGEAFTVDLNGTQYVGAPKDITYPLTEVLAPGATLPGMVTFAPTLEQLDECKLRIESDGGTLELPMSGLGGHFGHPFLHVVIEDPGLVVDYDADGFEDVVLDGSASHTHEPGGMLVGYSWSQGGIEFATGPVVVASFPVGQHIVALTITDNNDPPEMLSLNQEFEVHTKTAVPGVLARYYQAMSGTASDLYQSLPSLADFAEMLPELEVDGGAQIGSSVFTQNVVAVLNADVALPGGTYEFVPSGGVLREVTLDGLGLTGPVALPAGSYALQAKFAVDDASEQPLKVELGIDGGAVGPIDPTWLTHDQSGLLPVINSMPTVGTSLGGNDIGIEGLGFFPLDQVTVHWGGQDFTQQDFTSQTASEIHFLSPPGSGQIAVSVETPLGVSNERIFVYDEDGPVPINFVAAPQTFVFEAVSGDWGPDGRFYVGSTIGEITAIEFDEDYNVVQKTTYNGVKNLSNHEILGVAFNPHEPDTPVRIYVAHSNLFAHGGGSFSGSSPYNGEVSYLEGPNFDTPVPLITGLPVSNHDHGINGMVFDHNGDLLICSGGNTNAGVIWPLIGDLPESPFTACIIKARTSLGAEFDGSIQYVETNTGVLNNDQVFGEDVDPLLENDVFVYASGLRNPFDLALTTSGRIYATDNGPNDPFGPASTGPDTQDPSPTHPNEPDELLLINHGVYYGHPNRNRGRYSPEENVYYDPGDPELPGEFRQAMTTVQSSTNGITEYRSATFQGQMRGDLVVQKYKSSAKWIELSDDGESVENITVIGPFTNGLDVTLGPGGALLVTSYNSDHVTPLLPDDVSALGLVVHDITPWRAPATGGKRFVIGGVGFGTLTNTSVTIDGVPAVLDSVSPKRIVGFVPATGSPTSALLDVVVTVGAVSDTLDSAFRYLLPPGGEKGEWTQLPDAPYELGEVAAGAIAGKLYVVGEFDSRTAVYDLVNDAWLPDAATRPFPGHHHAAEVVDGKLYLIGGLGGSSEGVVQIYDPGTNLWTTGAPMPWGGGSVSTAEIRGLIYAAGGIVGTSTVNNTAVYDPVGNSWTPLAPMPIGRNHTAASTDGLRLYVFGGRDGGNFVANGFDDVQIYDPITDTWEWDKDGVSGLAPLPQFRGGMGKAVYYQGEFYVFGGETQNGPGAIPGDNVYDRVDVYDPSENTWRLDTPMPNPRHGIFPIFYEGRVLVAAGGVKAGSSKSDILDSFFRP